MTIHHRHHFSDVLAFILSKGHPTGWTWTINDAGDTIITTANPLLLGDLLKHYTTIRADDDL